VPDEVRAHGRRQQRPDHHGAVGFDGAGRRAGRLVGRNVFVIGGVVVAAAGFVALLIFRGVEFKPAEPAECRWQECHRRGSRLTFGQGLR
jgi:hypothetical protein